MGTSTLSLSLLKVIIFIFIVTMSILRVALLLSAVFVLSEAMLIARCPGGWSYFNHRCFNFYKPRVTWGNAEKRCQALGGNLASVNSLAEHNFIRHMIRRITVRYDRLSWIGGSDAAQERTWLWSDGLPMKYTNWAPGQPDNWRRSQNCMCINYRGGKWDDLRCNYKLPYVCVKDACEGQVTRAMWR